MKSFIILPIVLSHLERLDIFIGVLISHSEYLVRNSFHQQDLVEQCGQCVLYKVCSVNCTRCAVGIVEGVNCTRCAMCIVHCVQCVLYTVCSIYYTWYTVCIV